MLKMDMISILGCVTILAFANAGFLINDNTPVWIAYKPDNAQNVTYTIQPDNIVKRAIDGWRVLDPIPSKLVKFLPKSNRPNSDYWKRDVTIRDQIADREAVGTRMTRESLKQPDEKDIHVLVTMDYPSSWPTNVQDEPKYIEGKIVYAVAFWHGFHQHIKAIKDQIYNIHVVGIIIGRNKEAAPYLRSNEDGGGLHCFQAAEAMNSYWEKIAVTNADFPLDGRQVLATMTESKVVAGQGWDVAGHDDHHGFVYSDNLAKGMNNLDPTKLKKSLDIWNLAKFKYHGRPLGEGIANLPLPGQIISVNKQCEAWGYGADNWGCTNQPQVRYTYFGCTTLGCSASAEASSCAKANEKPPLDGTSRGDGTVCLRGNLVSPSSVKY